jgi:hypothetical protein
VVHGPLGVRNAYSGGPQLFRKLSNFSQQISKVYVRKKAKSEIENFKMICGSEGIWNWRLKIKLVNFPVKIKIQIFVFFFVCELNKIFRNLCLCLLCIVCVLFWGSNRRNGLGVRINFVYADRNWLYFITYYSGHQLLCSVHILHMESLMEY